ncbi:MAG: response regulator transcription factor [Thermoleophilia bacterium]|nr:response regulator transcription factor [Thermoleophilia bacterium]
MTVSVSIVEDFPIVRSAIADALAEDGRVEVRDAVASARDLLDALVMNEPDVALVDLHLPDMDGPKLIQRIRRLHPNVQVLVFSASERPALVLGALHAGARGYVVKRQPAREIADAIIAVHQGGTVLSPQVASAVVSPATGVPDAMGGDVTRLEQADAEIVRMVVDGETDEQIARALYVSTRTVQNRLTRIRRMARVQRRTELARWALENQIV